MINPNFVIIGALLQVIGIASYFMDTIKGKVQPNRVSWLLWSIAPLIAFAAQVQQGIGILSLITFTAGFCPLVIFIASFVNKKAEWKLTKFDLICGALSVAGLILWLVTKVGNIAILFAIIADGLAALPTIVKSYKEPETENDLPFTLGAVSSVIGLLTIEHWDFQSYSFPLYLLIVNVVIGVLIRFKLGTRFK